ncbi:MAG TPA: GAF domain-containing protein [Terriglobales bacterium]|jgi:putative methionine-R-sulfoxide reductase with GAF domain|nr:GAF domain-containing protein [Terriglobales bacterium]
MELSFINLQNSSPGRSVGERRRRIRHKLHSPVYASFSRPNTGMVLDLNELLDLSEDGFAVQSNTRLEVNQSVTFSLDLTETKAKIHGAGRVVWGDSAGRGGIRFSGLTEQSQRALKEWLLMNLFIAAMKNAQRKSPGRTAVEKKVVEPISAELAQTASAPVPDPSAMFSAIDAVRREVRAATDFDAALHLITERALSLTGASGTALAFVTEDKMVCRASAGEPAMPLGTVVDVKQGITGECVRSGRMVTCEDTETDTRVDHEICRMLGIGSIVASPIVADFRVMGLLEVFSPLPRAFAHTQQTALDRLVELVPKAVPLAIPWPDMNVHHGVLAATEPAPAPGSVREAVWEQEREAQEPLSGVPVRLSHIVLLSLTLGILFMAAGYVSAPKIEKLWLGKSVAAGSPAIPAASAAAPLNHITRTMPFDDLRKLAEKGDAEALAEMGSRYRNGDGVPQDDAQAAKWLERAAEQGHPGAQRALGSFYWAGRGVARDLTKAYFWSVLAAKQGDEIAAGQVQGLGLQMTAAEVAAAQQQVDDWLGQHRASQSVTK